jgi:hypothetical protein
VTLVLLFVYLDGPRALVAFPTFRKLKLTRPVSEMISRKLDMVFKLLKKIPLCNSFSHSSFHISFLDRICTLIVAFLVLSYAGIYVSPLWRGSQKEKRNDECLPSEEVY